jgi:ABC-type iron transport system FetAB ATPase subunit
LIADDIERHAALLLKILHFCRLGHRHEGCYQHRGITLEDRVACENFEAISGGRFSLSALSPLLLMEHPTRGLDMESTEHIWRLLLDQTEQGTAIVFLSSDLDELIDRSDRILIFFDGKVRVMETCGANLMQLGELIGGKGFE